MREATKEERESVNGYIESISEPTGKHAFITKEIIYNLDKLDKLLQFEPNTYYKFVVLLRSKDGETILKSYDKKEIIVKQWLIDSKEKLDETLYDMIKFAKLFNGRLYMTVDRKDVDKTLFTMQDKINSYLKQLYFGDRTELSCKQLNKILASSTSMSESSSRDCKRWLFDVDTKNKEVLYFIEKACGEHYITTLETKNGYHVIAKRKFDGNFILGRQYRDYAIEHNLENIFFNELNRPVVECKENALCLLYHVISE